MAAECAAMVGSADRLIYNLKLWDALRYGILDVTSGWRAELQGQGYLVTDARSLYDHVHGSSQLASERQTTLDIFTVRQMVQEKLLGLFWGPTWKQVADSLTKTMEDELFSRFRAAGEINVTQSAEDQVEEARRVGIRRAQRERRKAKMAGMKCS